MWPTKMRGKLGNGAEVVGFLYADWWGAGQDREDTARGKGSTPVTLLNLGWLSASTAPSREFSGLRKSGLTG